MKKNYLYIGLIIILIITLSSLFIGTKKEEKITNIKTETLEATVLSVDKENLTIEDQNHIIYTIRIDDNQINIGDIILLQYTGILDKNKTKQEINVINYETKQMTSETLPTEWKDNGIFKDYYNLAYQKLKTMTLEEKIGQIFLVRYKETNDMVDLKNYNFGGYVFFEKDFKNKTEQDVKNKISSLQKNSKIPLLTAVDEEGGKVVRVSSNENLVKEKFKSSKEIYAIGGWEKITQDTIEKSKVLYNLGLNLNLAPVVDVVTNENNYMFERSFGKDTKLTSTYAKTVIQASKNKGVSYTLKHFPGYGDNNDTHSSSQTDNRSYEDILKNDIPPFESGIKAGAEAVLVSHNIVTSIDPQNEASLSPAIHNILRDELNFTGIIITDDLDMGAIKDVKEATKKAILAGNDLIITTDYEESINAVKEALEQNIISENHISKIANRIIAWKYYKGLLYDNEK